MALTFRKLNLSTEITISNLKDTFNFGPGLAVDVPEDMADDVQRMEWEHQQYLNGLVKSRDYSSQLYHDPITKERLKGI